PAVDVAPADHERELDPARLHGHELHRERVDGRRVEPELGRPHQRLAGQLQQDPPERGLGRAPRLGDRRHQPSEYQTKSTSSSPPCSSAFATVRLSSWIHACSPSTDSAKKRLLSIPSTIFSRISAGLEVTSGSFSRISRSAATSSGGTCSRDAYVGREKAMCIASWRGSSGEPPRTFTSTPILCAGGWTYDTKYSPWRALIRLAPTTWTFSPKRAARSTRRPSSSSRADSPRSCTSRRTSSANAWKSSFFDTGSVSQPTATIVPCSSSLRVSTMPSVV